jgi:hypothetical protein
MYKKLISHPVSQLNILSGNATGPWSVGGNNQKGWCRREASASGPGSEPRGGIDPSGDGDAGGGGGGGKSAWPRTRLQRIGIQRSGSFILTAREMRPFQEIKDGIWVKTPPSFVEVSAIQVRL